MCLPACVCVPGVASLPIEGTHTSRVDLSPFDILCNLVTASLLYNVRQSLVVIGFTVHSDLDIKVRIIRNMRTYPKYNPVIFDTLVNVM